MRRKALMNQYSVIYAFVFHVLNEFVCERVYIDYNSYTANVMKIEKQEPRNIANSILLCAAIWTL